jgi:hypothetical protein
MKRVIAVELSLWPNLMERALSKFRPDLGRCRADLGRGQMETTRKWVEHRHLKHPHSA